VIILLVLKGLFFFSGVYMLATTAPDTSMYHAIMSKLVLLDFSCNELGIWVRSATRSSIISVVQAGNLYIPQSSYSMRRKDLIILVTFNN